MSYYQTTMSLIHRLDIRNTAACPDASLLRPVIPLTVLGTIHEACTNNQCFIKTSTLVGCFSCLRVYPATLIEEYTDLWNENGEEKEDTSTATALCFYCGCDCVLPDSKIKDVDLKLLREMKGAWLSLDEQEKEPYFTGIEIKPYTMEGRTVHRLTRWPKNTYFVWAYLGSDKISKKCIIGNVSIEKASEYVRILETAEDQEILRLI
jgi:hypothetical protein